MKIEETILNVKASFADSDEVPRLLGRTDVFKHFKITFDEQKLETIFQTIDEVDLDPLNLKKMWEPLQK